MEHLRLNFFWAQYFVSHKGLGVFFLFPLNAQFLRKHEISHANKNRSKLFVILNYSYQK